MDAITSAKITRIFTSMLSGLLLILMIFSKIIIGWFNIPTDNSNYLLTAFYICCIPGWIALFNIFRIMNVVIKDDVFSAKIVSSIRVLSWCCIIVFLICFIMGLNYIPLLVFALGSIFMALILSVLKNVMKRAIEIKEENDMTV